MISIPGCLGGEEEQGPITLKVSADQTDGHVQIVKGQNNQTISNEPVTVVFDFTDTFSGDGAVQTYWLEPGDGGARQEVNAADSNTIRHDYQSHGAFDAIVGANDSGGNSGSKTIRITAHLQLMLNESSATGTDDPIDVWWATESEHSKEAPAVTSLSSRIVNIDNIVVFDSETVDVTWTARDPSGGAAGTMNHLIAEGDEYTWEFEQNGPGLGSWVLEIEVEADDENVQAYTEIHVMYPMAS